MASGGGDGPASPSASGPPLRLENERLIGNGSFGLVYEARVADTGEIVAVKKVLQDKRFKNRELQIMKTLRHTNVVALRSYFYTTEEKVKEDGTAEEETYLNLVLEFVPETLYKVTRHYAKLRTAPPVATVKLLVYQMCRSLAYLHATGVCHRDIKPQNLLVDSRALVLKLCDFGSAKALVPGEPSVAYICSRYYRAPELIFGATEYTVAIDVWSAGCVAAELILGHPLFPGDTGVDQLVEIIKVLGTPTKAEVEEMNPHYQDFKFPQLRPYPWAKIFARRAPPDCIDLISRMLIYVPTARLTALQCCAHPFFDELRSPDFRPPGGVPLPALFNWSELELRDATPALREALVPPHVRPPGWSSARAVAVSGEPFAVGGAAGGGAGVVAPAGSASGGSTPAAKSAGVTPLPLAAGAVAGGGGGPPGGAATARDASGATAGGSSSARSAVAGAPAAPASASKPASGIFGRMGLTGRS